MNPCKECIVDAICKEPCYKMIQYLSDSIISIKPEGSPVPQPGFLLHQCRQMRLFPNKNRCVRLYFTKDKNPTKCVIEIEDGSVKSIRKAAWNEY